MLIQKVFLKQKISFTVKAQLGIPLLTLGFALTYINVFFLPLFLCAVSFMFSNYVYEFNSNLNHKVLVTLFGYSVIKFNKAFIHPDYISLFHQSFKQANAFGFLEFGDSNWKDYVIKFFNNKGNEIVFKSKNIQEVISLEVDLSKLLNVELHNTLINVPRGT